MQTARSERDARTRDAAAVSHVVVRRIVGLAIVAVFIFAACDSDESPRPVVKRDPAPLALRGGVLRDGLRVAPNSRLAGGVFDRPLSGGWTAMLEIERDPIGVYDNYVAQARRLGVPVPGSGARVNECDPNPDASTPTSRKCRDYRLICFGDNAQLICDGGASGGPSHPLGVHITLMWGGDTRHALLTVTHTKPDDAGPHMSAAKRTTPLPPLAVRPAIHGGRPGMKFGIPNNALNHGYRCFVLEEGSRVLADAPALDRVILQIDGNPEEVLGRYASQLANPDPAPEIERTRIPDGGTVLQVSYGPESGGAAMLKTDRTHRYLEIEYVSD
jgi:hypothetical protein